MKHVPEGHSSKLVPHLKYPEIDASASRFLKSATTSAKLLPTIIGIMVPSSVGVSDTGSSALTIPADSVTVSTITTIV